MFPNPDPHQHEPSARGHRKKTTVNRPQSQVGSSYIPYSIVPIGLHGELVHFVNLPGDLGTQAGEFDGLLPVITIYQEKPVYPEKPV